MAEHDFGYGDQVVVTKDISGAPAGTKAQFLQAVGNGTARVKITQRRPELCGDDVCYSRGAKITIPFNKLAPDDGRYEAEMKAKAQKTPWKPIYDRPAPTNRS